MFRQYSRFAVLLVVVSLFCAPFDAAQKTAAGAPANSGSTAQIDGMWALSIDPAHQGSVKFDSALQDKKIISLKAAGTGIQVVDPETNSTSTADSLDVNRFTFKLPVKSQSSNGPVPVLFQGSVSGNTISGNAKIDGVDVRWKAERLPSAWECSNHKNPSHVATTEDEMRSLTKQYHCTGWHKITIG